MVDGSIEAVKFAPAAVGDHVVAAFRVDDAGRQWGVEAVVKLTVQDRDPVTLGGELVALGSFEAKYQSLRAQFAQVVADLAELVVGIVQGELNVSE